MHGLAPRTTAPSLEEWFLTMHQDDVSRVEQRVRAVLQSGLSELYVEFRVVHPNGEIRWLSSLGRPIFDSNHKPSIHAGIVQDITERKRAEAALNEIDELEREMMRTVIPIFTTSSTARSRCAGIGVLTHEKAVSCAVVGPTARASGIPQDLRRDAPYAAYAEMKFEVPVEQAGDVRARLFVRALEIIESCNIIRQALAMMAPGEISSAPEKLVFTIWNGHQPR